VKRRRGEKETNRRVSVSPRHPVALSRASLITLLTDFGTADYFVGAVKGVILSSASATRIVDLTHEIPAQDIHAAAFTLLAAYKSFPEGTIHVAVVDPGVGSSRRGICVAAGRQFFVGPDNGIFSYIYERESAVTVFELSNSSYFREDVSATFHGRDVFAAVAAALANGIKPATFGKRIKDPVRLAPLAPERAGDGKIVGRVIHIDRFGNCVTNLTRRELSAKMITGGASLRVKGKTINSFRKYFVEQTNNTSRVFAIWGSAGFLEIAVANASAAKLLKVEVGTPVTVRL
jgi:S-adenosylmethionine hydrolase